MEFFDCLPEEITLDILSRVQTESLADCKSVCTTWNNLLHHPLFSKMHMHQRNHPFADSGKLGFLSMTENEGNVKFWYFENHDHSTPPIERITRIILTSPFKHPSIVGSCNGLICLSSEGFEPRVYICNPITREFVLLPQPNIDPNMYRGNAIGLGSGTIRFGYVASTNEYKVVAIYEVNLKSVEVHTYTLGSVHGWRNLGEFNYFGSLDKYESIYADGALYFVRKNTSEMITTFDLGEEKFCDHLLHPPLPRDGNWWKNKIGDLDGLLVFADWLEVDGADYYDLWVLKKKNDNQNLKEQEGHQSLVWNKEFMVPKSKLLFGGVANTGGVLTCIDGSKLSGREIFNAMRQFRKVFPHKNTLISLKKLGEKIRNQWSQLEEIESCD